VLSSNKLAYVIQKGVLDLELVCESKHNWLISAEARVDSGASMSSIDVGFVDLLRLDPHSSVLSTPRLGRNAGTSYPLASIGMMNSLKWISMLQTGLLFLLLFFLVGIGWELTDSLSFSLFSGCVLCMCECPFYFYFDNHV